MLLNLSEFDVCQMFIDVDVCQFLNWSNCKTKCTTTNSLKALQKLENLQNIDVKKKGWHKRYLFLFNSFVLVILFCCNFLPVLDGTQIFHKVIT